MPLATLTAHQRVLLEAQQRTARNPRTLRRTQALLWLAAGRTGLEVAQLLRVTPQSVYGWVARYRHTPTPDTLADRPRSGRPRCLGRGTLHRLAQLLPRSPERYGYRQTLWTVPLLQVHLQRVRPGVVSHRTLRRGLHALGYRWKRPRYVLAKRDPDRERKNPHSPSARSPALRYGHPLSG